MKLSFSIVNFTQEWTDSNHPSSGWTPPDLAYFTITSDGRYIEFGFSDYVSKGKNIQIQFLPSNPWLSMPEKDGIMGFHFYTMEAYKVESDDDNSTVLNSDIVSVKSESWFDDPHYTGGKDTEEDPQWNGFKIKWKDTIAPDLDHFKKWFPNFFVLDQKDILVKSKGVLLYNNQVVGPANHNSSHTTVASYGNLPSVWNNEKDRGSYKVGGKWDEYKSASNYNVSDFSSIITINFPSSDSDFISIPSKSSLEAYSQDFTSSVKNKFNFASTFQHIENYPSKTGGQRAWSSSYAGARAAINGDYIYVKMYAASYLATHHWPMGKYSASQVSIDTTKFNLKNNDEWFNSYLTPLDDFGNHEAPWIDSGQSTETVSINLSSNYYHFAYYQGDWGNSEREISITNDESTQNSSTKWKLIPDDDSNIYHMRQEMQKSFKLSENDSATIDELKQKYKSISFPLQSNGKMSLITLGLNRDPNDYNYSTSGMTAVPDEEYGTPDYIDDSRIDSISFSALAENYNSDNPYIISQGNMHQEVGADYGDYEVLKENDPSKILHFYLDFKYSLSCYINSSKNLTVKYTADLTRQALKMAPGIDGALSSRIIYFDRWFQTQGYAYLEKQNANSEDHNYYAILGIKQSFNFSLNSIFLHRYDH